MGCSDTFIHGVLQHGFAENLPRTVLMYYTNFVSSPEGYFHTVICTAKSFGTLLLTMTFITSPGTTHQNNTHFPSQLTTSRT